MEKFTTLMRNVMKVLFLQEIADEMDGGQMTTHLSITVQGNIHMETGEETHIVERHTGEGTGGKYTNEVGVSMFSCSSKH